MAPNHVLLLWLAVLTSTATGAAGQHRKIPEFIHVCKRNSPDFNQCITNSVEQLKPALETGVEGFLPSLEPLMMEELLVTEGNGFRIVGKNVKTYGCSNFRILNMNADPDNFKFEFDLELPLLYTVAEYDVSGRILLIPIKGNGPLNGNWTDCKAHVVLEGELEERNGYKFPKFNTLKINLTVGKGTVQLQNLFGGDRVLGNAVNFAINSNFEQVLRELQHPIEKALEDTLLEISNDCVQGFTLEQLCPLE